MFLLKTRVLSFSLECLSQIWLYITLLCYYIIFFFFLLFSFPWNDNYKWLLSFLCVGFWLISACLLQLFKQQFLVFKQHYTYFYTLFHPHIFKKNTNNITRTILLNRPLDLAKLCSLYFYTVLLNSWNKQPSIIKKKKNIVIEEWPENNFIKVKRPKTGSPNPIRTCLLTWEVHNRTNFRNFIHLSICLTRHMIRPVNTETHK